MCYISKIRKESPHILNVTNEVAANFSANGLIAIGASPSMSHIATEAIEVAKKARAVVLNLGSLNKDRAEAMLLAGKAANKVGIPVVLDPVAVGATSYRTMIIQEMLATIKFAAIRANPGEIAVLGNVLDKTTNPDSVLEENDPSIAEKVAKKYRTVVVATGKTDVISDGERSMLCMNGHPMLQSITASGCALTSIVAAFISVADGNNFEACIEAVASYGIAAELAMNRAEGPGSFIPAFLDQLYLLSKKTTATHAKLVDIDE